MPAEMRRIAVLSLEPDPGNAGVGMRLQQDYFIVYPRLAGMRFFCRLPQAFPLELSYRTQI